MNPNLKLLVAVAAIVVVVAGFAVLRPSTAGIGGPSASESARLTPSSTLLTPSPAVLPSAAIECEDDLPGCAGSLTAGFHQASQFRPWFSYTTTDPAPGAWLNVIDTPTIYKIDQGNPDDPYVLMWSDAAITDQSEPCLTSPDPSRGRKAADWIDFLTTNPALDASEPVSVDLGGRITGQQIELAVSPSWTTGCPGHPGYYVTLLTQELDGNQIDYGLPSTQRVLMTVVDVDDRNPDVDDRTVVMQTYGPVVPSEFSASTAVIRDLIATFDFVCGPFNGGPCAGK